VVALEQLLDCERKRVLFAAFVVIVCPNIVLDVAIISTDCSDGTCVLVEAIEVRLSWGCKVASPNPVWLELACGCAVAPSAADDVPSCEVALDDVGKTSSTGCVVAPAEVGFTTAWGRVIAPEADGWVGSA
jgi:hypothetical protein